MTNIHRRVFLGTIVAAGLAPRVARTAALMDAVERRAEIEKPLTIYDLNNPPLFPCGNDAASRRVWAAAVAEYLCAMGGGVGLDPVSQRINIEVDARGLVTRVQLTHPLLEIAAYVHGGGARVGIFYQPGRQSPLWATRHPDEVQYYGVFRDATAPPTLPRLIHRMRWLAGLEAAAVSRNARSREVWARYPFRGVIKA